MLSSHKQLIDCPAVGTNIVQKNDESRILVINRATIISFTPTEYKLLLPLLRGHMIGDNELVQAAVGCSTEQWKQASLKRYIDKLRCKIRSAGLDISRISRYGYILRAL